MLQHRAEPRGACCGSHAGVVKALLGNGDLEVELVDDGGVVVRLLHRPAAAPDLLVALGRLLETAARVAPILPCHLLQHTASPQCNALKIKCLSA